MERANQTENTKYIHNAGKCILECISKCSKTLAFLLGCNHEVSSQTGISEATSIKRMDKYWN